jgi:transglutaminase-like putative cysteine protease
MNQRRHITLVAAGATLLASLPLATVFAQWTWLFRSTIVVAVLVGIALLVRSFRAPAWTSSLAMVGGLVVLLTLLYPSGHEFLGLIPTADTLRHFNALLVGAGEDMRDLGIPVEDRPGLLFLVTLGLGGVAVVVDFFAVVLRRPALAGLPMLAIYSVPVTVHEDSVNVLPFIIGAAGFLWLLVTDNVDRVRRFGRRFTGDGRDVDLWEPSPLAAAGRRLAVVGVVLAVLLPFIVPGMTSGLLDRFGSIGGGGGGIGPGTGRPGPTVSLFALLSGNLNATRSFDMIRVTTNDPTPYYLRFGTADEIAADGFHNHAVSGGVSATSDLQKVQPLPSGPGIKWSSVYRARVDLLDFNMTLLPTYVYPKQLSKLDSRWRYEPNSMTVYSSRALGRKASYNFEYVRVEYTDDALRSAQPLDPADPIRQAYAKVPNNPRVHEIVTNAIKDRTSVFDKVRALKDFLSVTNGFKYSTTAPASTTGNAIADFLTTGKQGFCEQYAAALAWMARDAGIPARVAFGFTRGSNTKEGVTTLTNLNLHAWTEVYFKGLGWVPFDATPAIAGSVGTPWSPTNSQTGGGGDPNEDIPVGGGGVNPSSSAAPNELGLGSDPFNSGSTPTSTRTSTWPVWVALGLLVVLFLLITPALRRAMLRRQRRPDRVTVPAAANGTDPPELLVADGPDLLAQQEQARADRDLQRERAHAAWDELIDTMVDYRIEVDESETPRNTADRLATSAYLTAPEANSGVRLLGKAEERARYARVPLETDDLASALSAVRTSIARRVSRRTRVRAIVLPPSVVERWRLAVVIGATNSVNAIAAHWDRLVETFNVRRLFGWRRPLAGREGQ